MNNMKCFCISLLCLSAVIVSSTLALAESNNPQQSRQEDPVIHSKDPALRKWIERERRWYREVLDLSSIIPRVLPFISDIRASHPEFGTSDLFVESAQVCFGPSAESYDECNARSLNVKLKERVFWVVYVSRRVFGEGGGAALFFRTGAYTTNQKSRARELKKYRQKRKDNQSGQKK